MRKPATTSTKLLAGKVENESGRSGKRVLSNTGEFLVKEGDNLLWGIKVETLGFDLALERAEVFAGVLEVARGSEANVGDGVAGDDHLGLELLDEVEGGEPGAGEGGGEQVGDPDVEGGAEDGVTGDEGGDGGDPEEGFVNGVTGNGSEELDGRGFVTGEREEAVVVGDGDTGGHADVFSAEDVGPEDGHVGDFVLHVANCLGVGVKRDVRELLEEGSTAEVVVRVKMGDEGSG